MSKFGRIEIRTAARRVLAYFAQILPEQNTGKPVTEFKCHRARLQSDLGVSDKVINQLQLDGVLQISEGSDGVATFNRAGLEAIAGKRLDEFRHGPGAEGRSRSER